MQPMTFIPHFPPTTTGSTSRRMVRASAPPLPLCIQCSTHTSHQYPEVARQVAVLLNTVAKRFSAFADSSLPLTVMTCSSIIPFVKFQQPPCASADFYAAYTRFRLGSPEDDAAPARRARRLLMWPPGLSSSFLLLLAISLIQDMNASLARRRTRCSNISMASRCFDFQIPPLMPAGEVYRATLSSLRRLLHPDFIQAMDHSSHRCHISLNYVEMEIFAWPARPHHAATTSSLRLPLPVRSLISLRLCVAFKSEAVVTTQFPGPRSLAGEAISRRSLHQVYVSRDRVVLSHDVISRNMKPGRRGHVSLPEHLIAFERHRVTGLETREHCSIDEVDL
ncbi:hypothetical protein BDZ89DRAFT_1130637 [Hymenopellis radicata]|nr:hypothetical protein BDZ89DRAFT_1130637 [Hymenopellis radicata]